MTFEVIPQALLNGLVAGCMYALMAVGFSLIFGVMDIPNFAQGEFYMLGAYISYFAVTKVRIDPLVSTLIAMGIVFFIGLTVEKLVLSSIRKRYAEWLRSSIIATIGFSILFQNVALVVFGSKHRSIEYFYKGIINISGVIITIERLIIILATLSLIIIFWVFIKKTSYGRAMQAVAQDREAALLMGINPDRIYTITFGLGTALAAAAGSLLLPINLAFPTVGGYPLLFMFIVVIFGGFGSIPGAIAAGYIFGTAGSLATVFISSTYQEIASFLAVIILLIFRPSGLFGVGR